MKINKINVLHIINSIDFGGAEYNLIDVLNNVDGNKFNIHLIYLQGNRSLLDSINNKNDKHTNNFRSAQYSNMLIEECYNKGIYV